MTLCSNSNSLTLTNIVVIQREWLIYYDRKSIVLYSFSLGWMRIDIVLQKLCTYSRSVGDCKLHVARLGDAKFEKLVNLSFRSVNVLIARPSFVRSTYFNTILKAKFIFRCSNIFHSYSLYSSLHLRFSAFSTASFNFMSLAASALHF